MRLPKPETSFPMARLGQRSMTLRQLNLHLIMEHQILRPFLVIPAKA